MGAVVVPVVLLILLFCCSFILTGIYLASLSSNLVLLFSSFVLSPVVLFLFPLSVVVSSSFNLLELLSKPLSYSSSFSFTAASFGSFLIFFILMNSACAFPVSVLAAAEDQR